MSVWTDPETGEQFEMEPAPSQFHDRDRKRIYVLHASFSTVAAAYEAQPDWPANSVVVHGDYWNRGNVYRLVCDYSA